VNPPLLKERDAAAFLAVTARTLQTWRFRREGPPYIKLSGAGARRMAPGRRDGGAVRYRESDLRAWLDARTINPETTPLRAHGRADQSLKGDPPSGRARASAERA
jgi:hypothetical protein